MARILVSGLINIETTLAADGFPIHYSPVRYPFFGVRSTVSGVGYNVAKALTVLGDAVELLSVVGRDAPARLVSDALRDAGIRADGVLPLVEETPQSVIIYDPEGRRQINVDLKDVQEQAYPAEAFERALARCELAALCNINFSRPMLAHAKQAGVTVATDVHAISSVDDEYNAGFMRHAGILFLSDEHLPTTPEAFAGELQRRWGTPVIVIGLGAQGALLAVRDDGFCERTPAVTTRTVVNTVGAGDALFSAFVHHYARERNPYEALRHAMVFASYKIGERGAADGFLSAGDLARLVGEVGR